MGFVDMIREKTDAVGKRSSDRFRAEVDEVTGRKPDNYEEYPLLLSVSV